MTNFNAKLNLMKLSRAGIMQIQGRGEVLRCLVIPVEENHLFVSTDENNRPKAAYLDLSAWEMQNPKYEETHFIKQSLPKEVREQMTEEQKKSQPILGGMKPIEIKPLENNAGTCDAPFAQVSDMDGLPFWIGELVEKLNLKFVLDY